jgi:hypothetical protein
MSISTLAVLPIIGSAAFVGMAGGMQQLTGGFQRSKY